ncbi:hypothetical protein SAMN05660489_05577 [Pseudomonas sp. LAMO17WK12:I10]|nr:hypothetical protein H160_05571 [Pseudomonas sp. LAMO17WK12:I9]SNY50923.1 hypothetical protein SAMN05660489_05577 [Pseudomonas sp. LAMO17WK12:I10]
MRWSARCTAAMFWQVSTRPVRSPFSRIGSRLLTTACEPSRITRFPSPAPSCNACCKSSSGHSCCNGRPSAALIGNSSSWARAGLSDCTMPWLSTAATPLGMCCSTACNAQQGVAVGLWSLVLTTEDGGKTWTEQPLQAPPGAKRADLNLMGLFADSRGTLYATAEHGQVLHSEDHGKSWRYLDTGYEGTLWSGAVLDDGSLLLGGQRGTLLHGSASEKGFRRLPTQSKGSVTSVAVAGPKVLAVGLEGLMLQSSDGGHSFQEKQSADGVSLTAALFNADGAPVLFSRRGVIPYQE